MALLSKKTANLKEFKHHVLVEVVYLSDEKLEDKVIKSHINHGVTVEYNPYYIYKYFKIKFLKEYKIRKKKKSKFWQKIKEQYGKD